MKRLLLLLTAAASLLIAQPPDVIQTGTLTGVGNGTPLFVGAGGPNGAVVWRLTFFVDGTNITAAQLAIQGAQAPNAAGCTSASYTTIAAAADTVIESSNPSVSGAQGNIALKTYYPCIRARATAATGAGGTISYQLAGWKFFFTLPVSAEITGDVTATGLSSAQADGSTNTPDVPAVSVGGAAATVATNRAFGFRFNGATWDRDFICNNRAAFNLSGSGNTQIVALSGSTVIRICHVSFTTVAPEDVKFTQGTGSNCASGTADISGLYKQVTGLALDFTPTAALRSGAGNAICLNQSVAQALGGIVIYAQY